MIIKGLTKQILTYIYHRQTNTRQCAGKIEERSLVSLKQDVSW